MSTYYGSVAHSPIPVPHYIKQREPFTELSPHMQFRDPVDTSSVSSDDVHSLYDGPAVVVSRNPPPFMQSLDFVRDSRITYLQNQDYNHILPHIPSLYHPNSPLIHLYMFPASPSLKSRPVHANTRRYQKPRSQLGRK